MCLCSTFVILDFYGHHAEHEHESELVAQPGGQIEARRSVRTPRLVAPAEESGGIRASRHEQNERTLV